MNDEQPGITVDDLPAIYRQGFLEVVEMGRALHDPATNWDDFREYVWRGLTRVFGLL